MKIYTIADLHLAISIPNKTMEVFGDSWKNYHSRIEENWKATVKEEDLVLIPGDITWAKHLEEALIDLNWIAKLPGKKVLLKGNHDLWWPSNKKLSDALPPSIQFINNSALAYKDISVAGTRLWDSPDFSFEEIIHFVPSPYAKPKEPNPEEDKRIFEKELVRLEKSLELMDKSAKCKIVMTHYPPLSYDLKTSVVSELLEKYGINYCVFGHLHNVIHEKPIFGEKNHIEYVFCAADYLQFMPKLLTEL